MILMLKNIEKQFNEGLPLIWAFFFLVLSQSIALQGFKVRSVIEYLGLFLLIIQLIHNVIYRKSKFSISYCILIFGGLTIGLILQNMSLILKMKSLVPACIFGVIFTLSDGVISNIKLLKKISYSIFFAVLIALFLAIFEDLSLFEANGLGGPLYIGFNGGILYKNYFSSTILSAFIGLFLSYKLGKGNRFIDVVVMLFLLFLLFCASSNGTILILLSFLVCLYLILFFEKITSKLKSYQKKLLIILLLSLGMLIFIFLYISVALNNQNYIYRIRGLINYISSYKFDFFHLIFGNGELAYAPGNSYVENVISVTGWDGTLELAWLNILIKNGIIGVVVYLIVFIRAIIHASKCQNTSLKALIYSIVISLMVSSLVETYIQNIHVIFGIYMFLLLYSCQSIFNGIYK